MKFKQGVNPFGIKTELSIALQVCDTVYKENNSSMVVTSINDSKHSSASLHYNGCAADLRIWDFTSAQASAVVQEIKNALGNNPDYDVILESDHIHIEYQPKFRS